MPVRTDRWDSCPNARCRTYIGASTITSGKKESTMTDHSNADSSKRFAGLRVAVTGGTSGLGLALVCEALRGGARVAFVARSPEHVESVASGYPDAHGIVGDLARKEDIHP